MTEFVSSTKNQIKRFVPNAKDIFIKIERDHEHYCSKIHVQIPGAVLHSEKKAESAWEALTLSYHAILKQVDKYKAKKRQRKLSPRKMLTEFIST